jgi:hypothetical protein
VLEYRRAVEADAQAKLARDRADTLQKRVHELEDELEALQRGVTPYRGPAPALHEEPSK